MCVTVLYPRNTKKGGRRKTKGVGSRPAILTHSHTSSPLSSSSSLSLSSSSSESLHKPRALSTAAPCGYGNDYIVYSPDYVIPIAQNGKKSLTHEWMAETSGWDSERKEHQFISLELSSISLVSSRFLSLMHIYIYTRIHTHIAYIYTRTKLIYTDIDWRSNSD